jgi:16S rRNA (uracil1498-N3)-methyltransferase
MTRRRWIADAVEGDRAFLIGTHAQHLARVLRARIGQEFDIATPAGVRRGTIQNITDERVEFELGESVGHADQQEITLLLAIFKFDRMEWAIEKCTELGVTKILPVVARRTDFHLASAAERRVERWKRIVTQAAEQSRRAQPPDIALPMKLKDALSADATGAASLRIVLAESEEQLTLVDAVGSSNAEALTLAVGPEGGWTDEELNIFRDAGWLSASLGQTILRAETAAIAATAIVIALRR